MDLHPSVVERLGRLTADQRAAATAPPGPVLCVAPAGSGKTTTLVARIAWLLGCGAEPDTIAAITFNKRAAEELAERLDAAVEPLGVGAGAVRVRTFHAGAARLALRGRAAAAPRAVDGALSPGQRAGRHGPPAQPVKRLRNLPRATVPHPKVAARARAALPVLTFRKVGNPPPRMDPR